MSRKVLITGVTGQDGSNMADYLLKNTKKTVVGGIRRLSVSNHSNIEHLKDNDRFRLIDLDVTDQINTTLIIQEEQPDYFINFAANSFVGSSWSMPENHMMTNSMPVMYQLEAIRRFAPHCRYYNAGSSEQFGDVKYSPQDMDHPFRPRSPYGISKCAAHHIVKVWRESYGLYAVQGILFNHEGTRRGEEFVTRKITKGVARIRKALDKGVSFEPILLGNLEAKRDWSDSEDFMDGIWRMLNQQRYHVADLAEQEGDWNIVGKDLYKHIKDYVLSSGETHSIREFVEVAFASANIQGEWTGKKKNERFVTDRGGVIDPLVRVSEKFYRPNEVDLLLGDAYDAKTDLEWEPKISFERLVERMVETDLYGQPLKHKES